MHGDVVGMGNDWQIIARLIIACILGGFIGLERESHGRPAGLRTHILVCVGSTLIMVVSAYAFPEFGLARDPARLAAQVVSGIGFLGAGTIMREGANIRGLTTAASLWVVAGIGLAVGSGFYIPAVITAVLAVGTLTLLDKAERNIVTSKTLIIEFRIVDQPGQLGAIAVVLGKLHFSIRDVNIEPDDHGEANLTLQVVGRSTGLEQLAEELKKIEGILKVRVRST
jgi:putative Mg2+ transporter-C (MgtC) family protein